MGCSASRGGGGGDSPQNMASKGGGGGESAFFFISGQGGGVRTLAPFMDSPLLTLVLISLLLDEGIHRIF